MSSRPATAPPGSPPERILARVVTSGVTPAFSWAPPGATRKPVTTSSKMRRAPALRVSSRRASRKEGGVGTTPKWPPVGSRMTAATSPLARRVRTAARSFGGSTVTSATTSGSWPASGPAS